jgi:hypothetical protein
MRARRLLAALAVAAALAGPALPAGAQERDSRADCEAYEPAPELGRYVVMVYARHLGRCPSEADLDYWVGRLEAGLTRTTFVEGVARSTEGLDRTVAHIYSEALDRPADEAERGAARSLLRSRRDAAPLLALVYGSDEHYLEIRDGGIDSRDERWIDAMYDLWLGRHADAAGGGHFLATFGPEGSTPTTRARVVVALLHSAEGAGVAVRRAYAETLARQADPAGAEHWEAWLRGPGRHRVLLLRSLLLASHEGFALVVKE